ncbi:MAG: ATP-binding cassette domain-containing protein [Actinomycetales bacterium]|nr:ATP-binding cassette domain-containing protein [Actinomycetales bacterium]
MITLRGVTKRYGEQVVLDGLDLDLPDGAVTALMGPNGSGKTTLARLVLGLEEPDAGEIDGLAGRRVVAAFQEDRLCEQLSAVGNVRLVLERTRVAEAATALREAGLDDDALAKPVRELSGGQRRRVALVRALVADADVVVLDEPFKGLDRAAHARLLDVVRERTAGRTVLLITHDAAEAEALGAKVVTLS